MPELHLQRVPGDVRRRTAVFRIGERTEVMFPAHRQAGRLAATVHEAPLILEW